MQEINSGTYSFGTVTNQKVYLNHRVMAGIRANPLSFKGVVPVEHIFVAITGENGIYRKKKDIDGLIDALGVAFVHDTAHSASNCDCLLIKSDKHHAKLYGELHKYADVVYPDVAESEQTENETEQTEQGDDRPF